MRSGLAFSDFISVVCAECFWEQVKKERIFSGMCVSRAGEVHKNITGEVKEERIVSVMRVSLTDTTGTLGTRTDTRRQVQRWRLYGMQLYVNELMVKKLSAFGAVVAVMLIYYQVRLCVCVCACVRVCVICALLLSFPLRAHLWRHPPSAAMAAVWDAAVRERADG